MNSLMPMTKLGWRQQWTLSLVLAPFDLIDRHGLRTFKLSGTSSFGQATSPRLATKEISGRQSARIYRGTFLLDDMRAVSAHYPKDYDNV